MNRSLLLLFGVIVASLLTLQAFGAFNPQSTAELTEDQIKVDMQKLETYIKDAQKKTGVPGESCPTQDEPETKS